MHVPTRLHGHGAIVVPAGPFEAELGEEGTVALQLRTLEGPEPATIFVDEHGARITPRRFGAVTGSEYRGPWRLETSLFGCQWPRGFKVFSDPESGVPFDLVDGEAMVFVQGLFPPERFADPAALVAQGQIVVAEGAQFLEVTYEHQGVAWAQRHEWRPHGKAMIAVTAQAPRAQLPRALEGQRSVLDSVGS